MSSRNNSQSPYASADRTCRGEPDSSPVTPWFEGDFVYDQPLPQHGLVYTYGQAHDTSSLLSPSQPVMTGFRGDTYTADQWNAYLLQYASFPLHYPDNASSTQRSFIAIPSHPEPYFDSRIGHASSRSLEHNSALHTHIPSSLAHGAGVAHAFTPPETTSIPSFVCRVHGCGEAVVVRQDSVSRHLRVAHGIKKGQVTYCPWEGCVCAARAWRVDRNCAPNPHPAHVQDLAGHIWERHLGFRFVCPSCDRVDWADRSSLNRHLPKCTGRMPARCAGCYAAFGNQLELIKHTRELGCGAT